MRLFGVRKSGRKYDGRPMRERPEGFLVIRAIYAVRKLPTIRFDSALLCSSKIDYLGAAL